MPAAPKDVERLLEALDKLLNQAESLANDLERVPADRVLSTLPDRVKKIGERASRALRMTLRGSRRRLSLAKRERQSAAVSVS